jgi:hypothetical protein
LVWNGIYHSATNTSFDIRFNSVSTSKYYVKGYSLNGGSLGGFYTAQTDVVGASYVGISAFGDKITGTGDPIIAASGFLLIDNYASTTRHKPYTVQCGYYNLDATNRGKHGHGIWGNTAAITSIDVFRRTGTATFSNNTNTSIRLYGIS